MGYVVSSLGVFLLSQTIFVFASDPLLGSQIEMATKCDKTIDVSDATILHTTGSDPVKYYNPYCEVRIRAKLSHQIIIHSIHTRVTSSEQFCNEYLQIFDGPDMFSPRMAGKNCSSTFPKTLVSTSREIYVYLYRRRFHISNTSENKGYELLLIPFHTGECNVGEYMCSNGRCIDRALRCNKNYDTCGNESCDTVQNPIQYLFIGLILIGFIIIIAIIACCWYRWKKRKQEQSSGLIQNSTSQLSLEGGESFSNPVGSSFSTGFTAQNDTPSYPPPPYSADPQIHNYTVWDSYSEGEVTQPPPYEEVSRW